MFEGISITAPPTRVIDGEQVIATFDFSDDDPEKLSFVKGDIMQVCLICDLLIQMLIIDIDIERSST